MFRFLFLALLVAFFGAADAFAPGVNAAAALRSTPAVEMSTKYTVAAGLAKKKPTTTTPEPTTTTEEPTTTTPEPTTTTPKPTTTAAPTTQAATTSMAVFL